MKNERVLMAMSGGIDSGVSALLLKQQGYELIGCTFVTTPLSQDTSRAEKLARQLGIEHHVVDLQSLFRQQVILPFIHEYACARTPNPCVLCNPAIKFGAMWQVAQQYDCQYIATGHYARIQEQDAHLFLRRAADAHKDQTYFLWRVSESQLAHTIFPLGDYTKNQVRNIACQFGYTELAEQRESQEICFIPNDDYRTFLHQEGCVMYPGDYVNEQGRVLGQHAGFQNYTIGQRKGLGIALGKPAFVTRLDADHNRVTLGDHDDLYTQSAELSSVLFRGDISQPVMAQIRFRSCPVEATLTPLIEDSTRYHIRFSTPVWAITPGQSAVFYQNDLLVGGGFIETSLL